MTEPRHLNIKFFQTKTLCTNDPWRLKQGVLPEGGTIAVKRLAENAPVAPGKTFDTEVTNLMVLQHDNIVQLVGYCHEAQKKVVQHNGRYMIVDMVESCLCYKYLPNGTLDKYLYGMQCTIQHISISLLLVFKRYIQLSKE